MLVILAAMPLGCTNRVCAAVEQLYEARVKVKLPKPTKWAALPVVQVCDTAPVTSDEVRMLLAQWEAQGAPKLTVVDSKCAGDMPDKGFIQIDMWRLEWRLQILGAFAVTVVWPDIPEAGLIMVPDGNMAVLRHELGHIWFQGHAAKRGHVLCPYVDCIGDDWSGVRRAFRGWGL